MRRNRKAFNLERSEAVERLEPLESGAGLGCGNIEPLELGRSRCGVRTGTIGAIRPLNLEPVRLRASNVVLAAYLSEGVL